MVDGLPGRVQVGGVSFGVDVDIFQQASFTNNPDDERAWRLAAMTLGSAEEHGIFEQLLNVPAVSTVRLVEVANARRVPILAIDRTNVDRQMARLDTFCEDFIRQDAEAGFVVIVPERNLQFEQWLGIAWIRVDPRTGASNWFICGGLPLAGGGSARVVVIDAPLSREQAEQMKQLKVGVDKIVIGIATVVVSGVLRVVGNVMLVGILSASALSLLTVGTAVTLLIGGVVLTLGTIQAARAVGEMIRLRVGP